MQISSDGRPELTEEGKEVYKEVGGGGSMSWRRIRIFRRIAVNGQEGGGWRWRGGWKGGGLVVERGIAFVPHLPLFVLF